MLKGKQTAEEIAKAEQAKEDRQNNRSRGFELMKTRDSGHGLLKDYNGKAREVWMLWGQNGKFKLEIKPYGAKSLELVFDAEEFRKWLRWA